MKKLQKPLKLTGTLWIAHEVMGIDKILANYSIFMAHIKYFSQTDSQALKWVEIKSLVGK